MSGQAGFQNTDPLPPVAWPIRDFFRDGPIVLTKDEARRFREIIEASNQESQP